MQLTGFACPIRRVIAAHLKLRHQQVTVTGDVFTLLFACHTSMRVLHPLPHPTGSATGVQIRPQHVIATPKLTLLQMSCASWRTIHAATQGRSVMASTCTSQSECHTSGVQPTTAITGARLCLTVGVLAVTATTSISHLRAAPAVCPSCSNNVGSMETASSGGLLGQRGTPHLVK